MKNELLNIDCMEYMKGLEDNAFDLAIIDPPYGLPKRSKTGSGKLVNRAIQDMYKKGWDIAPNECYFNELFRISKNQIIWGGNYFNLPPNRGFIVWDKCQPWKNFAACEYAWNSIDGVAKIYKFDNRTGGKIHPTQKPVALYKWLLKNYAKPGDKLLDTHSGSGSFRIAAHDMGFDLVSCELDADYCKSNDERFKKHTQQGDLFGGDELQELIF